MAYVSMREVIVFGLKDCVELAHHFFRHDSSDEVVAFSVHREYRPKGARVCRLWHLKKLARHKPNSTEWAENY